MTYGEAVTADESRAGDYIPQGLAEGGRLLRQVRRDAVLTRYGSDRDPIPA